jgi:hypothetical protein
LRIAASSRTTAGSPPLPPPRRSIYLSAGVSGEEKSGPGTRGGGVGTYGARVGREGWGGPPSSRAFLAKQQRVLPSAALLPKARRTATERRGSALAVHAVGSGTAPTPDSGVA